MTCEYGFPWDNDFYSRSPFSHSALSEPLCFLFINFHSIFVQPKSWDYVNYATHFVVIFPRYSVPCSTLPKKAWKQKTFKIELLFLFHLTQQCISQSYPLRSYLPWFCFSTETICSVCIFTPFLEVEMCI